MHSMPDVPTNPVILPFPGVALFTAGKACIDCFGARPEHIALEGQDLPRRYLANHELESVNINIIIIV